MTTTNLTPEEKATLDDIVDNRGAADNHERIDAFVAAYHARLYPGGCRSTWADMCEACCVRLGGGPREPLPPPDTPVVWDCGHTDQSPDYRYCLGCGWQILDHNSFSREVSTVVHPGARVAGQDCPWPVYAHIAGPCPGCRALGKEVPRG